MCTPELYLLLETIITLTWPNLLEGLGLLLLDLVSSDDGLVVGVCKRTEPETADNSSALPSTAARALNAPAPVITFPSVTGAEGRNYKPVTPLV